MASHGVLVGDIGGTHARFAILERNGSAARLRDRSDVPDEYPSLAQTLTHYLDSIDRQRVPDVIVLAVAGPVSRGKVRLTNRNWQISESELLSLGFRSARLINDFAALAYSADRLGSADLRYIGPEIPAAADGTTTILGAGTGFGVSYLARCRDHTVALATEEGTSDSRRNVAKKLGSSRHSRDVTVAYPWSGSCRAPVWKTCRGSSMRWRVAPCGSSRQHRSSSTHHRETRSVVPCWRGFAPSSARSPVTSPSRTELAEEFSLRAASRERSSPI